ncbi:hypothetical protein CMQ_6834 [Grosmannia clavigera kw1407]|uniref:GST N-terminal domain-containing protein n=1 Tax=Grosmannia clavigera (strain kw1407 / UAMH 11150) TaxID=655863 RepID=F0X6N6_GROCL|nr:uncharacterized protein CMQ_6834 [Grosmannia clavigera kw1407]EFX06513.1 hypothetical protein CMQ_6834 [Grosmannia clavigera kw1407]
MARHTALLGPTTLDARPPKIIALRFVNREREENLGEEYLVRVNPKGQVPAMTGNVLEQPLTDSESISLHLAEKHYPSMLPIQHAAVIRGLLDQFHSIHGQSFSNKRPTAAMVQHNPSPVEGFLKRTDLSPEYRRALETKLLFHNENNGVAFHPDVVAKAKTDLQAIFAEIVEQRRQNGTYGRSDEWIFGSKVGPTVLDSHLLPLVLRCVDAENSELVPEELQHWATDKAKSPAWQKVMHGRPTRWDESMGRIEDMEDMRSW